MNSNNDHTVHINATIPENLKRLQEQIEETNKKHKAIRELEQGFLELALKFNPELQRLAAKKRSKPAFWRGQGANKRGKRGKNG